MILSYRILALIQSEHDLVANVASTSISIIASWPRPVARRATRTKHEQRRPRGGKLQRLRRLVECSPHVVSRRGRPLLCASPAPAPSFAVGTSHGEHPIYRVDETLRSRPLPLRTRFSMLLSGCRRHGGAGSSRNRFQAKRVVHGGHPSRYLQATDKAFAIRFDKSHVKRRLPASPQATNLGSNCRTNSRRRFGALPVSGLQDIIGNFRQLGGSQ